MSDISYGITGFILGLAFMGAYLGTYVPDLPPDGQVGYYMTEVQRDKDGEQRVKVWHKLVDAR